MKRILPWLVMATLLIGGTPVLALQPHSPVFVDASQPATVNAGEDFFIALPSNVTTGYSWTAQVGDNNLLAYEGNVYQPPLAGLMGAGGQQIFILHANRSGTTTITFSYAAPFNANAAPSKTLTFTVTVK